MGGTVTEALRHIKAEPAALLDAPTILALCHEVGYQWRAPARSGHHRPSLYPAHPPWPHRVEPPAPPGSPTLYGLGVLSSPYPVAACRLAAVTASDGRGLRADDPRRGTVAWAPHVSGRWVQFFDA
jgi:hypothetical protein